MCQPHRAGAEASPLVAKPEAQPEPQQQSAVAQPKPAEHQRLRRPSRPPGSAEARGRDRTDQGPAEGAGLE